MTATLDEETLDALAGRVADLLAERTPEPYLNVEQAAGYLACSRQRIYDLVSSRRLAPLKDGARSLFRRADLDAVLEPPDA